MEISDKSLKEIEELLNDTISSLLYGGGGDPIWQELNGAASCYKVLRLCGLKVNSEEEIRATLESENIFERNFLEPYNL